LDNMHYNIELTFNIRVAKWRIDDPRDSANAEYSLFLFDRNKGIWVHGNDLQLPGEIFYISKINVLPDGENPWYRTQGPSA